MIKWVPSLKSDSGLSELPSILEGCDPDAEASIRWISNQSDPTLMRIANT